MWVCSVILSLIIFINVCVSLLQIWLRQVDIQHSAPRAKIRVQWEVPDVRQNGYTADIRKRGNQCNFRLVPLTLVLWVRDSSGGTVTTLWFRRSEAGSWKRQNIFIYSQMFIFWGPRFVLFDGSRRSDIAEKRPKCEDDQRLPSSVQLNRIEWS